MRCLTFVVDAVDCCCRCSLHDLLSLVVCVVCCVLFVVCRCLFGVRSFYGRRTLLGVACRFVLSLIVVCNALFAFICLLRFVSCLLPS